MYMLSAGGTICDLYLPLGFPRSLSLVSFRQSLVNATMATVQRSRYPRPLKAMHTFTGPTLSQGAFPSCPLTTVVISGGVGYSTSSSVPTSPNGTISSPLCSTRRLGNSPERRSPVPPSLTISNLKGAELASRAQHNPRRSNSMGSLSDPDCYMNSTWPRLHSSPQHETEEVSNSDTEVHEVSHKRSSSYSHHNKGQGKSGAVPPVHSCISVEGLNQEVSLVLEGEPLMMSQHPDGHIAPVRDLLKQLSVGTQTSPHRQSRPSSHSPSPYPSTPHTSSPPSHLQQPAPTHSTEQVETAAAGNILSRDSPATPDHINGLHPPSPKPSFAREPPDGAERCVIKQETRLYSTDFIQKGPDRSKCNIVFKGTAFSPLLTTPLTTPTIAAVNGIQC